MLTMQSDACIVVDMTNNINTAASPERLRARLEARQGSTTSPHRNRHREAKQGRGKGGRNAWKRGL